MRPLRRTAALAAAATLILAAGACDVRHPATEGARAPAFAAPTLEGEQVTLADLRGEVVLLNVWATWCWPCRREMPSFEALHRELAPQGLRVVAVSIDDARARGEIRDFLDEYDITFTILHDPRKRIADAFQPAGVPETYLIDASGVIRKRWIGRIDGRSEGVREPIRETLRERALALGN
jgi:cytochrome c biogenesis protein CcmG, thiol:disulfide interchange protein DsbE